MPQHEPGSQQEPQQSPRRTAGAFDIRSIIAALLGVYGLVVLVTGLVQSDGRAINVWSGIGLLVVAAMFLVWARLRPTVVPDEVD